MLALGHVEEIELAAGSAHKRIGGIGGIFGVWQKAQHRENTVHRVMQGDDDWLLVELESSEVLRGKLFDGLMCLF